MKKYLRRILKISLVKHYWNYKGLFTYYNKKVFFPRNSLIFSLAVKHGIYEQENIRILQALIKPDSLVFDVGANIGLMAIPLLDCDSTIKVISIEASPNTLPFLEKTNFNHPDKRRWKIVNKAVSDHKGKVRFYLADAANGSYESMQNTNRAVFDNAIEIDCVTINSIWKDNDQQNVSVIKIDIEGADLLALRGASDCIKKCKPAILMEWNNVNIRPYNLDNTDLVDFVDEIGYIIYALPGLNKVHGILEMNLFSKLTENFLLIAKE